MHRRVLPVSSLALLALSAFACGTNNPSSDAAADSSVEASQGTDAVSEPSASDAAPDSSAPDAVALEASVDVTPDTLPSLDAADASADASTDAAAEAAVDSSAEAAVDASVTRRLECVPAVSPNELNSGMVLSAAMWVGFRFQVPAGTWSLTRVGLNADVPAGGSLLAGVVALTGSGDNPDTPNLTGSDVRTTTLLTSPVGVGSRDISGPASGSLAPGWYALVVGTGAMGATSPGGSVHSNSSATRCASGDYPFSLRQSDGMLISQAISPNFYVELAGAP